MVDEFKAHSKEVLRNGKHFADAIDEDAAANIAGALNHQEMDKAHIARDRSRWGLEPDLSEGLAEK